MKHALRLVLFTLAGLVMGLGSARLVFADAYTDCDVDIYCPNWIGAYCANPRYLGCSSTDCVVCMGSACTVNGQSGSGCRCAGSPGIFGLSDCWLCVVVDAYGNVIAANCTANVSCPSPHECEFEVIIPGGGSSGSGTASCECQ